jgi:glycosyltransferase involved in cell wall biosynthesis
MPPTSAKHTRPWPLDVLTSSVTLRRPASHRPIAIFWLRLYCAHMPLTLVPTAALCDELAALGFRKRSMSVWGRGVDARVFAHDPAAASALRAELGIGARTLLLCWTSRIVREKRFDIFTTVFDRLKSDGFDVHALVAGVPSDESGAQMLEKFRAVCVTARACHGRVTIACRRTRTREFSHPRRSPLASLCVCHRRVTHPGWAPACTPGPARSSLHARPSARRSRAHSMPTGL